MAENEIRAFEAKCLDKVTPDYKPTWIEVKKPQELAVAAPPAPPTITQMVEDEKEAHNYEVDSSKVHATTTTGDAVKLVEKANAKYEEAMKSMKQFNKKPGNNNALLDAALPLLEEALDLYEKVLKIEPNNRDILQRQNDATMMVYVCHKNHTL